MIEDYDDVDYDYFIEWDIEQYKKEIERLKNIIKEVREYCNNDNNFEIITDFDTFENHNEIGIDILEILDKVGSEKE